VIPCKAGTYKDTPVFWLADIILSTNAYHHEVWLNNKKISIWHYIKYTLNAVSKTTIITIDRINIPSLG